MIGNLCVKLDEITAIQGQKNALLFASKLEDRLIWNRLMRLPGLQGGQHLMSQILESQHRRLRKIFVSIQPSHLTHFRDQQPADQFPRGASGSSSRR